MQRSVTRKQLIKLITHSRFEFSAKKRNSNETNVTVGCYLAVEGLVPSFLLLDSLWSHQRGLHSWLSLHRHFPVHSLQHAELPLCGWGLVLWQHWWQILPQRVFQLRKHLVMQGPILRSMAAVLAESRLSSVQAWEWLLFRAWHLMERLCGAPQRCKSWFLAHTASSGRDSQLFTSPASFIQLAGLIIVTYLVCALVH